MTIDEVSDSPPTIEAMTAMPVSVAAGIVLREVINERCGSVNAYCKAYGLDRRNLQRYLNGRDMQLTTLLEHLGRLDHPPDNFMQRVAQKVSEATE